MELAKLVGLKPRALEEWRRLGKGPSFIRLPKGVRYPASAVRRWLDGALSTYMETPKDNTPPKRKDNDGAWDAKAYDGGFVIELLGALRCPMALCEDCGMKIANVRPGVPPAVVWRMETGPRQPLRIVCKGCLRAYQASDWCWMPLHLIMLQLLDNMGIARPEYDGRDADRFSQGRLVAVSDVPQHRRKEEPNR